MSLPIYERSFAGCPVCCGCDGLIATGLRVWVEYDRETNVQSWWHQRCKDKELEEDDDTDE